MTNRKRYSPLENDVLDLLYKYSYDACPYCERAIDECFEPDLVQELIKLIREAEYE